MDEHAFISVYAVDMETGKVLVDENSHKSLFPASTLKLVTTAAALQLLGPEAHFETDLEYDGVIDHQKNLCGNLYIRGGGDPCLGSDRFGSNWKEQLKIWADAVQNLGILTIQGTVVGDATRWESALAPPSWLFEDLGNYYGAGASALSFHENSYTLFFKPGREGEVAEILRTEPPISTLQLKNEVKTGPVGSGDRACIYGIEYVMKQIVRGTVPAGVQEFSIKGAIPDPASCATLLLEQELHKRGITIKHQMIKESSRTKFHTTYSPPIKEIVRWTNQKSINLYAEHLLKKMGEAVYNEGSTQAGIRAVHGFLTSQKIDMGGFNMADGSGLSRKNYLTARQLVTLLVNMKTSDHFPLFFESLPQKGSLVRAKTGSQSFIRSLSGYAGKVAFAIIINQGLSGEEMQKEIDSFVTKVVAQNRSVDRNNENLTHSLQRH
jgi:D-alanyl-D-alanine carboxypeptidase/D-alanyl-D-alanine-endopeptidase (penicillin-binding protein 4)